MRSFADTLFLVIGLRGGNDSRNVAFHAVYIDIHAGNVFRAVQFPRKFSVYHRAVLHDVAVREESSVDQREVAEVEEVAADRSHLSVRAACYVTFHRRRSDRRAVGIGAEFLSLLGNNGDVFQLVEQLSAHTRYRVGGEPCIAVEKAAHLRVAVLARTLPAFIGVVVFLSRGDRTACYRKHSNSGNGCGVYRGDNNVPFSEFKFHCAHRLIYPSCALGRLP